MNKLISYFIKYPISGNLVLVLLLIFGYFGLKNTPSNFFPKVPTRNISIRIVYPGASPEEVEEGVVLKIEDNLRGLTGIEKVTSTSQENSASINVEIIKGYEVDIVLQDVKNAVDRISSFPADMEPPVIYKIESVDDAILFALNGETDLRTLKSYARKVERDLLNVEGISQIDITGFPDEEIEISMLENKLRVYQLTMQEIMTKVRGENLDLTGGIIKGPDEELYIRARNKKYYAEDLSNIIIKANPDGSIVRLKDVAVLKDRWSDVPNRNYYNGQPSISFNVKSTTQENIITVAELTQAYIQKFNEENDLVHIDVVQDRTNTLRQRIDLLLNNGIVGFVLVAVILALFLNIRLALWVAIAIPVSLLGMFILAVFSGITINVISLFGMILVIGILVDDGIVISENIYQHYERGSSRMQAAIQGTMEVLPAVISAILTTMVAFSAFFFIDGRLGDFFSEMAVIVIATLAVSLVEGALILPAHVAHSKALQKDRKPNQFEKTMTRVMDYMRDRLYAPLLRFCIEHRVVAISGALGLLIITFGMIGGGFIKTTFFPFIERDFINVDLSMPSGTRDHITEQYLTEIEEAVWKVNEEYKSERPDGKDVILAVERKLGPTNTHKGALNVVLLDTETRNLSSLELTNAIRDKVGIIAEAEQLSYGVRSVFGKPVSVSLLGNNIEELKSAVEEVKLELNQIAALKDVVDNDQEGLKEVIVTLKEKAYLLGLTSQSVLAQVRQGFFGGEIQRLQRGLDEIKVWVRFDETDRSGVGYLEDMRIRTPTGEAFPVRDIAHLDIKRGVVAINHLDGQREIKIEADIGDSKASVTDLMSTVRADIIPKILNKYPNITARYEGQNKEQQKSQQSMQQVMPVILLLMIAIVIFTFRSFSQSIMVFLLIPFGFIGVGLGHFVHDKPISLFSILGIIALVGILVNDALVFVSAFNNRLKQGATFDEALYDAGLSRFRPILLTSITTIAGLAPLILNKSFQAQFLIPMAISVAYGLFISTFVVLMVLPAYLSLYNQLKRWAVWYWYNKKPNKEAVERAVIEDHSYEEA